MKILLAQMKPQLGNVVKNLEIMVSIIEDGISKGAELIVFPELSLTGYLLEDLVADVAIEKVPETLLELSKKISIIFGAVEQGKDRYLYNSAFYLEDGKLIHIHRKVYLPTYGMFDEGRYFRAGQSLKAFDTKFGRFGMLVCEDMWHQSSAYVLSQDGAEHIFCLVNSPARGFAEELFIQKEWHSLAHSTALTNTVFVTMINRVGVEDGVTFWGGSEIVDPTGEILCVNKLFEEDCSLIEVDTNSLRRVRGSGAVAKNENVPLVLRELKRIWKETN